MAEEITLPESGDTDEDFKMSLTATIPIPATPVEGTGTPESKPLPDSPPLRQPTPIDVQDELVEEPAPEPDFTQKRSRAQRILESIEPAPALTKQDRAKKIVQDTETSAITDYMLGLNRAIGSGLDFIGAPISIPLEKLGLPFSSNGVQRFFEQTGSVAPASQEPDSAAFHAGKVAGETLMFSTVGGPLGRGVQAVQAPVRGAVRQFGRSAKQFFGQAARTQADKPLSTTGFELLSASTAGIGGFLAQERSDKVPEVLRPTALFLGQMLGGIAPSVVPARLVKVGAEQLRSKLFGKFFDKTAVKARVEKRLQENIEDPQEIIRNIDDPDVLPGIKKLASTAELSKSDLLLELQQSIVSAADKPLFENDIRIAQMSRIILESLAKQPVNVTSTKASLRANKRYMSELLDTVLEKAARDIDDQIGKLKPGTDASVASQVTRKVLGDVENLARVDESRLWGLVPANEIAWPSTTVRVLKEELLDSDRAKDIGNFLLTQTKNPKQKEDIFNLIGRLDPDNKQFVPGAFAKGAKLGELQTLRSRVLQEIRSEGAGDAPNQLRLRKLDAVADALLQDLGAAGATATTPESGQLIAEAIGFSRLLNDRFRKGPIGLLKGSSKSGTARVPDTLTLESTLGFRGPKAAENARQLIKAAKTRPGSPAADAPEAPEQLLLAMDNFIKGKFSQRAVSGGKVNRSSAEKFLVEYDELLRNFPETRRDIEQSINLGEIFIARGKKAKTIEQGIKGSLAALYIEKSPSAAFDQVRAMDPPQAQAEMKRLLKLVKKNSNGLAEEGLRESFVAWIYKKVVAGARDVNGDPLVSGFKFKDLMKEPSMDNMLKALFPTIEEQTMWRQLVNSTVLVEKAAGAKPSKAGIFTDAPNRVLMLIGRLFGASQGSRLADITGTGGIQMQAILSQEMQSRIKTNFQDPAAALLTEIMLSKDRELFKQFLTGMTKAQDVREVRRRLHSWLAGVFYDTGERAISEESEEQ